MPIYDIITPDREGLSYDAKRELNNRIYFQTTPNNYLGDGFITFDDYLLGIPTGPSVNVGHSMEVLANTATNFIFRIRPINITIYIDHNYLITISTRDYGFTDVFDENTLPEVERIRIVNELKTYVLNRKPKSAGRNLIEVARVGKNRDLPENIEDRIASFLSGKPGKIAGQANKLKQNVGYNMAPRARKTRRR